MTLKAGREREKGAALIVVLLLVATLSFILLSITNTVTASVERSTADRARADIYWRAAAGEQIARVILSRYLEGKPARMAPNSDIFAGPIETPIEGGRATINFYDATACFNLNSLVAGGQGSFAADAANVPKFAALLEGIGLGTGEARKIADVIIDFVDSDDTTSGQGAEDGFYTALPTPYRTGGQLIRSVSELRAMDGVSRAIFQRVRPFLCALDTSAPMAINGNMLRPAQAPLAAALLGPDASAADFAAAIEAMPPGGVAAVTDFPSPLPTVPGISTVSNYIEAQIRLEVNHLTIEEKLLFDATTSPPKLIARTFGDDF